MNPLKSFGNWVKARHASTSDATRPPARRGHRRPLRLEPLEDRRLLDVSGLWQATLFDQPHTSVASGPAVQRLIDAITTTSSTVPVYGVGEEGWDGLKTKTDDSGPLVNMDAFRADSRFAGIDGSGFATVILDTGIDLDHPFFGPDSDSDGVADRIVYDQDFVNGDMDASDDHGHGSNVSSIAVSQDATFTGMAPGSDIISLKVLDAANSGTFADVESALQWVVTNAATHNIASVNMSLGDNNNYNTPQTLHGIDDELTALVGMNVTVVSSSGNHFFTHSSAQGVGYPSADPNSLSIGAVYDANVGTHTQNGAVANTTDADRVTPYSQRHSTLTTIMAPGTWITGADTSGGTTSFSGTSQAAPHISGIAALSQQLAVQQLGRRLTQAEFANLLQTTGATVNDGDDEDDNVTNTGLNFPRVDMLALGNAIRALATDPVIDAGTGNINDGSADEFRLVRNGGVVELHINGSFSRSFDYATLNSITVNGSDDADTLIVDHSGGVIDVPGFIAYDGNALTAGGALGDDALLVAGDPGGTIQRETYLVGSTPDAGRWVLDPNGAANPGADPARFDGDEMVVDFLNLEPADTHTPAALFDVILPLGATADVLTIEDGPPLSGFQSTRVTDHAGTFETFRFARKDSVRIHGMDGGDTFTLDNPNAAEDLTNLEVYGHAADDVAAVLDPTDDGAGELFMLSSTAAAVGLTSLYGQDGNDTFDNTSNGVFSLDGLAGDVDIVGGEEPGDADLVQLQDPVDLMADQATLTSTTLSGAAPAEITYHQVETFVYEGTNADDTIDVLSTAQGTQTWVAGDGGSDTITVGAATADFGTGAGTLDNILGDLILLGDFNGPLGDADTLNVDDSGDADPDVASITDVGGSGGNTQLLGFSPASIEYVNDDGTGTGNGFEFVNIRGSAATTGNTIAVNDTTASIATTLDSGTGNDANTITINGDNLSGDNLFLGNAGNDRFVLNITDDLGADALFPLTGLRIEGNAHDPAAAFDARDRLEINELSAGSFRDLRWSYGTGQLSGFAVPIDVLTMETITYAGDPRADWFRVEGTAAGGEDLTFVPTGVDSALVFLGGTPWAGPPDDFFTSLPGVAGGAAGPDLRISGIDRDEGVLFDDGGGIDDQLYVYAPSEDDVDDGAGNVVVPGAGPSNADDGIYVLDTEVRILNGGFLSGTELLNAHISFGSFRQSTQLTHGLIVNSGFEANPGPGGVADDIMAWLSFDDGFHGFPILINGGDPLPTFAPEGDRLETITPGEINLFSDKADPPTVSITSTDPASGVTSFPLGWSSIESMLLTPDPSSQTVNIFGDNNDPAVDQNDNFVIVGADTDSLAPPIPAPGQGPFQPDADGDNEFFLVINGSAPIGFRNVATVNAFGDDQNPPPGTPSTDPDNQVDRLEITPYADDTPTGWGIDVAFDEGNPEDGDALDTPDLVVYNGVAGVSEEIIVQPSGPGSGQVIVRNAATGTPIAVIDYTTNTGIEINANDGSAGDTDVLILRGTDGTTTAGTSGNETVEADFTHTGLAGDPIVAVSDTDAGVVLYELFTTSGPLSFDVVHFELDDGDDTMTLNAGTVTVDVDAGRGNDLLEATASDAGVTLRGGEGDDTLRGSDHGDRLDGGPGRDTLEGGPGDDTLLGGSSPDLLFGGPGNDQVDGGDDPDTYVFNGQDVGADDRIRVQALGAAVFIENVPTAGPADADVLGDIEQLEINTLNSAATDPISDQVTIDPLLGTELEVVHVDGGLERSNRVVLNGSDAAETITVGALPGNSFDEQVLGLGPVITMHNMLGTWGDTLEINGRGGDDVIQMDGVLTGAPQFIFDGGPPSGSDTLVVEGTNGGTVEIDLAAGTITGVAPQPVEFANFEAIEIVAGNSTALSVVGAAEYAYVPGPGVSRETFTLLADGYDVYSSGYTDLRVTGVGADDELYVAGTAMGDRFTVEGSTGVVTLTGGGNVTITPDGIETLLIEAFEGDDTVDINGAVSAYTTVEIRGGDPGSGSDVLNLVGAAGADESVTIAPDTTNSTEQDVTGLGAPIDVSGVELITYTGEGDNDDLTVNLGAGGTRARVDRGTADDADLVTSDSLPDVEFAGLETFTLFTDVGASKTATFVTAELAGAINYQMDAGGLDTLVIEGSDGADDVFTVDDPDGAGGAQVRITDDSSGIAVSEPNGGLARLQINTLGGDDGLTVDVGNTDVVGVPITFDGGEGSDNLTVSGTPATAINEVIYTPGPDVTGGRLLYQDALDAALMTIDFANLEPVVDLVPAAMLTVSATDADNAINYVQSPNDSDWGLVSVDAYEPIEFAGKVHLTINAMAGDDLVHLDNPETPTDLAGITVNGGGPTAGSDRVVVGGTTGGDAIGVWLTAADSATVQVGTLPLISAQTVEWLAINGQGGNDDLTVTTPGGGTPNAVTFTPGPTPDAGTIEAREMQDNRSLLPMGFTDLGASSGTLTLANADAVRTDLLDFNGTDLSDVFRVSSTGAVQVFDSDPLSGVFATLLVHTPGVQHLNLHGLAGDDTFNLGGPIPFANVIIDAGDPSASDIVNITGNGTAAGVTLGDTTATVTGGGLGTVNLLGVEILNFHTANGNLTVSATDGDDTVEVTPTDADAGTLVANRVTPVLNFSHTDVVLLNLLDGSDALIVHGDESGETIAVDGSQVAITGKETINYSETEALSVHGAQGNDTFDVTPAAIPIFIDGGDPIGVTPGDRLNVVAGADPIAFEPGPEADEGAFLVGANQRVSFDHIEGAGVTGSGPALVLGTNDDDEITIIARDASTHAGTDGVRDFTVTVNDGPELLFVDVPELYVDALAGDDDIVVRAPAPNEAVWDVDLTIAGGPPSASDRLVVETPGTNTVRFTPTGADTGTFVLDQTGPVDTTQPGDSVIEITEFTLTVGQNDYVSSPGGVDHVVYDGENGPDDVQIVLTDFDDGVLFSQRWQPLPTFIVEIGLSLSIELQNIEDNEASHGTITLIDPSADDDDNLAYVGSDLDEMIEVLADGSIHTAFSDIPLLTENIEHLFLFGNEGDDTISLVGGYPFDDIYVAGGDPDASDVLNLSGAPGTLEEVTFVPDPANSTQQNVLGFGGPIHVTGVELITYTGSDGNDTLTVDPGLGNNTLRVESRGLSFRDQVTSDSLPRIEFLFLDIFRVDASSGNDVVTFATRDLTGALNYELLADPIDVLVIEGVDSASSIGNDSFTVTRSAGGSVTVTDNNWMPAPVTEMTGALGRLQINTLGGDDLVTVDVDAATPSDVIGVPITFDGGGGSDLLVVTGAPATDVDEVIYTPGPLPTDGRLLYQDTNDETLMTIDFVNLEPAFEVSAATLLTVDGTDADNAINYTQSPADPDWGLVSVDEMERIHFANKDELLINALAGDDVIHLNNPTTPTGLMAVTVHGGDPTASDTVIVAGTTGTDAITVTPTAADAATVQVGTLPPVTVHATESLVINGLGGDDHLSVVATADDDTIVHAAGDRVDAGSVRVNTLLAIEYLGLGTGGIVTIDGRDGNDTLEYVGTPFDDLFSVAAGTGTVDLRTNPIAGAGDRVDLAQQAVERLVLDGLDGDDLFDVNTPQPYELLSVQAAGPGNSDLLQVVSADGIGESFELAPSVVPGSGSVSVDNAPISYSGIENVHLVGQNFAAPEDDDLVVYGDTADNVWDVDQGSLLHGFRVQIDDRETIDFTGFDDVELRNALIPPMGFDLFRIHPAGGIIGSFTVTGAADADVLEVIGTGGGDVLGSAPGGGAQGTATLNVFPTPILFGGLATVRLLGGDGDDVFDVTPIAEVTTVVEAGGPAASDTLNVTVDADARVTQGADSTTGTVDQTGAADVDYSGVELLSIDSQTPQSVLTVRATDDNDTLAIAPVTDPQARVSMGDGPELSFNNAAGNFARAVLQGRAGDDLFSLSPIEGVEIVVEGGGPTASDKLIYDARPGQNDLATITPTDQGAGTVTNPGTADVTYTDIEELALVLQFADLDTFLVEGTEGNDFFQVFSGLPSVGHENAPPNGRPGTGTVLGLMDQDGVTAAGAFSLPVITFRGDNLNSEGIFNISGAGGTDTYEFHATAVGDEMLLRDDGASTSILHSAGGQAFNLLGVNNVSQITLHSGSGDDAITVDGGIRPVLNVNGGDPSASDVLNLLGAMTADESVSIRPHPLNSTQQEVIGLGNPINVSGVELITYVGIETDDTLRLEPGAGDNVVRVAAASGAQRDLVTSDSLPRIEFTGLETFLVDTANPSGADVVTFAIWSLEGAIPGNYQLIADETDTLVIEGVDGAGTVGNDNWTLTRPAPGSSVAVANAKGTEVTVTETSGTLGRLQLNTLGGDDRVTVDVEAARLSDVIGVPITFDGGGGSDLLVVTGEPATAVDEVIYTPGPDPTEGRLTYEDTADAALMTIDFANLEPTFELVAAGMLTVDGTDADNAITYVQKPTDPTRGLVLVDGFELTEFANKGTLVLDAMAGDDVITLNNPATPAGLTGITVHGGDPAASDTVIVNGTTGADTITYTPTGAGSATITGAQPVTVTVTTAELVVIDGQGGDDDLTLVTPAGNSDRVTYTPGPTVDAGSVEVVQGTTGVSLLPMQFEDLEAGGTVTIDDSAGGTGDELSYVGTALDDVIDVSGATGPGTGLVDHALFLPVLTDGIETLRLNTLAGDDLVNVQVDMVPYTNVDLDGGEPDASDVLTLANTATATAYVVNQEIAAGLPTITALGTTYTLSAVEAVVIDALGPGGDTLEVRGATSEDDTLTYGPLAGVAAAAGGPSQAGTFRFENSNLVYSFRSVDGTFTVDGGPGANDELGDHLIVQASTSHDVVIVDSPARTVAVENPAGTILKTVTLAADVEILTTQTGLGNDTIMVIPAPNVGAVAAGFLPYNLLVNVDGGPPSASDALVIAAGAVGVAAAPLPATDFVVVNHSRRPDEGTVRVFRNAVAMPDISYTDIEVVSPIIDPADPDTGDPNLLILGPDLFEQNEYRETAAYLGSGGVINVENLAIFPNAQEHRFVPEDQDYFRVVAEQTGTLDFQVYFRMFDTGLLPQGGDINIEVLDEDGTVIAGTAATNFGTADTTPNARIRIPAVAGQTYYLHAFGANNLVVGGYDVAVLNQAPPVPYDLELHDFPPDGTPNPPGGSANSDTGRSQFDNVTYDNTPVIYFRLDDAIFLHDLPGNPADDAPPDEVIPIPFNTDQTATTTTAGYRIAVFDEGDPQQPGELPQVPIGYARQHAEGVYVFDFDTDSLNPAFALTDGSHFISARAEIIDPADPTQSAFTARSQSLQIVVDTTPPPVFFGEQGVANDGLHPDSDTGIEDQPATFVDRITSDSTPSFWGIAEANTVVRVYADTNGNGALDPAVDLFLGEAVAIPEDGTNQFPRGLWNFTTDVDMNDPAYFPDIDGLRTIFATAEDLAGNLSEEVVLAIFIDTRGPQVDNVLITDHESYDLFDPKPTVSGPTPLIDSLDLDFVDRPPRLDPPFFYPAVNEILATQPGNIIVVGDRVGIIPIESIELIDHTVVGDVGRTTIRLNFFDPLPDDRFTITVSDRIKDRPGNPLDGESNAHEPQETPQFPSGDGDPGEDFVARFTVDSRPEIGTWSAGSVYLDINGNFLFDPQNENQQPDYTHRDLVFTYGFTSDDVFAGNFTTGNSADGFDKLGAYGRIGSTFRWLIDLTNDGVPDLDVADPAGVNGLPVAGNFDGNLANGDEVGLFTGTVWWFDTNHDFMVDTSLPSALRGWPIVGNFDGFGGDDLGVWTSDRFAFDLSDIGGTVIPSLPGLSGAVEATISFGFVGVRERPVAADMDQDGIDDVGVWVPDRSGVGPEESGEWYFLFSNDRDQTARVPGTVVTLDHPFEPAPFGSDVFAQFGDDYALPIVGNFDPPVADNAPEPSLETVSLRGTSGDDVFEFRAADTPDAWTVTLNGVPQAVGPETAALEFDGRGGNDTVRLTGSSGHDAVELWANRGTLTGDGYTVTVSGVHSILAAGGGGQDEATFHDSAADDTFTGWAGGGLMTGPNMSHRADGFAAVYARATAGGHDTVKLYDSPGNDDFVGTPTYAKLSGDAFAVETRHFESVNVFATAGGLDVAKLYDSAEDDTLRSTPQESAMLYGTGSFARVKHFEGLHTYATAGGSDTALLYDSDASDDFVGTSTYGALYGEGFYNRAKFFEIVHATSGAGVDVARFYDSPADDRFLGKPDFARLSGDNYQSMVSHFAGVHAYATAGGVDVADMYDSGGDDKYVGLPDSSAMYRPGRYYSRAKYFEQVHAHSDAGGTDRATVYDAVLGSDQAVQPPPGADPAAAKVAWLYQFEAAFTASSSSDDEPVAQAVDEILKAYWP